MIHFDFIVDDADAENIFDCVTDRIVQLREEAMFGKANKAEAKALMDIAEYLEQLKAKMTNTRVGP